MNNTGKEQNQFSLTSFLDQIVTYIISFYLPVVLWCGIIGNILIFISMTSKRVNIRKSAKIYYITIAIGDLGSLIFQHFRFFISTGLWFLTSGRFHLTTYSPVLCKIWLAFYYCLFSVSMYTVIAFSIERNLALYFPLHHRNLAKRKLAIFLLIFCVGIPCGFIALSCIGGVGLFYVQKTQLPICGGDPGSSFYVIYSFSLTVFVFELPEVITTLLVIALLYKIRQIKLARAQLRQQEFSLTSKDLKSIMALLSVALINLIIFLPTSILYAITSILRYMKASPIISEMWISLFQVALFFGAVTHSLNFFVYYIQIPSFKDKFACYSKPINKSTTSEKSVLS